MEQSQAVSERDSLSEKKQPRPVRWSDVAQEVAEYFQYEPRVPAVDAGGSVPSDPFGRILQFPGGAGYHFMMTVYDRLKAADREMPYVCDGDREQPSASMVLRAALGVMACKYDDSAPRGAHLLKKAQEAYARAATYTGRRVKSSAKEVLLRRFDLVFSGAITIERFESDEED